MPQQPATRIMDELIAELSTTPGPCERVIDEYIDGIETGTTQPIPRTAIHEKAHAIIQELRESWGPTADPYWVNGIVPGRGVEREQTEFDCFFALFHRPGVWGYVRIRALETTAPEDGYLRLVLGVAKDSREIVGNQ